MSEGGLKAVTLTNPGDLTSLVPQWRELWAREGGGNPFTHPDWVTSWLANLSDHVKLWAIALFQGNDLIGLAPLGRRRVGPWHALVFLGSPEADYPDLLFDNHPELYEKLVACMLDGPWDWLDLLDIHQESRHLTGLEKSFQAAGLKPVCRLASECPSLAINSSWEEYWGSKKRKFRYNLNRSERQLGEEVGPVEYHCFCDKEEVTQKLSETIQVHAARWSDRHTRTIFSKLRGIFFFQRVVPLLAREGLARLYLMRAGGRLVSFSLSFVSGGRHYYYIPGFDPDYSKYSPGTLLLKRLIAEAHEEGLEIFDLMKGEEEYKKRWANQKTFTVRLLARRPGPWAKIGYEASLAGLKLRDWARSSPGCRRLYYNLMDPLSKLHRRSNH